MNDWSIIWSNCLRDEAIGEGSRKGESDIGEYD
jgi:hypothetical protein